MSEFCNWNVFIGSMNGVLKGVRVSEKGIKKIKNLVNIENIDNKNEITCINWGNQEENEILVGYSNQVVKIFDIESKSFSFVKELKGGEGSLKGISKYFGKLLTGVESGEIKVWDVSKKVKTENNVSINAGPCLERMRHSAVNVHCVATGGKENDLKLWDLEKGTSTFTAKNVRPDELQLRVPVWVSDIAFLPESPKVAISSRHGFVRLYDPNSSFRRPVVNVHVPDQSLTCIAAAPRDGHVVVGSGTGHMFLVDLRNKGILLNHYKGFVGGIKQIACPPKEPYIISVGLDRNIRVHNLNKQLMFKEYLQSRLTCVLLRSNFSMIEQESYEEIEIKEEIVEVKEEKDEEYIKESTENEKDQEYEEIFKNMETVGEKRSKLQHKKKRKKHKHCE
ncbi:WD repeat domain 74 lethal (2) k09848 [Lycorma delicatula]|uniref:WD repeat domain 74 lethal (2) k09848 n=1 Tax=Lycorma delicatula TaxID=130591 RepID=UPI003F514958